MKSIDTIRLRALIGWLGLLLPWIILGLCIWSDCVPYHLFPDSISVTYHYEPTITPFVVILGSAGLLLICYRGYCWFDDLINTLTGIAALVVCLFPCYYKAGDKIGTFQLDSLLSEQIHTTTAIIFFCLLAYNALFIFTKSSGNKTKKKKIRNAIYIICGIGILLSLLTLFILIYFCDYIYGSIWFVEAVALFFFGISYLTKADIYPWLFCDSAHEDKETDNS